jgi:tRNA nucleotidyltransferase (CCA-adding enzyme)
MGFGWVNFTMENDLGLSQVEVFGNLIHIMVGIACQIEPGVWKSLQKLAALCDEQNGRAFLVGGCVRSALLGEPVLDFDVEVFGLPSEQLESILNKLGPVARVGKSFGIFKMKGLPVDVGLPRRERKSGTGHRGFDVDIDPGMSLEEAAMRRDFTINALYCDILKDAIVDPLEGLRDLEGKILRHCSDRFPEDPLRVLRAMQFASRIPAQVAPETVSLCKGLSPENLSRERYFAEWEKLILLGKVPSVGLNFLLECGWINHFPELAVLTTCEQDPQWHPEGNVWEHTLHCMDAFSSNRTGNHEEDLIVGLAVLCHDMGKASTTEHRGGKIISHGHESAGTKPARSFMQRLNVPNRIVEQVIPLVRCHMRPAFLYADKSSPSAIRRLARDAGRIDLLLRVFAADAAGRPPLTDNSNEAINWIKEQASLMNVERSGPAPLIRGKDLLDRGWQSGPDMGRFLKHAYELQLDGVFTSHEEARAWLDQRPEDETQSDTHSPEAGS